MLFDRLIGSMRVGYELTSVGLKAMSVLLNQNQRFDDASLIHLKEQVLISCIEFA